MDVLVVADSFPYPLQNGHALRIFHYTRLLNARNNFDLICFGDADPPSALKDIFRHIVWFPRPISTPASKPLLLRIRESLSISEMLISSQEMKKYISHALEYTPYDLIWGAGDAVMANIPAVRKQPLLGDLVDDGVLASLREARHSDNLITTLRKLKWAYLNARFERRFYGTSEHCLVVSETDASWFHRICPATPISVIHNGVDEKFFKPLGGPQLPLNIVFEGTLAFGPNHDGIIYFYNTILPLIQSSLPETTLTIVGKDPPSDVFDLSSDTIEVTGYVEDIRPYLDRAALFVCPLRKGAGIKNKILQAWSMAKPVVATSHSVGGLKVKDGENIFIRDNPKEFAAAVVHLLTNPHLRESFGQAGRMTILSHYTWGRKAAELESLMTSMVSKYNSSARTA